MHLPASFISLLLLTLVPAVVAPAAEPVTATEKPITLSRSQRLASGHWMESRAILSRTGRIDVSTHTWSKSEGSGFHGAVIVFLVDEHGNRLSSTAPRSYGVNSKHLPGDDRTDSFHEEVPAEIIAQADGLVIQHLYQPESEFLDRLRDAKESSGYLASILRDGAEILLFGALP
ncbi:MAG: hypothetical protein ACKO1M_14950 [Planctomycetota bacterium]